MDQKLFKTMEKRLSEAQDALKAMTKQRDEYRQEVGALSMGKSYVEAAKLRGELAEAQARIKDLERIEAARDEAWKRINEAKVGIPPAVWNSIAPLFDGMEGR